MKIPQFSVVTVPFPFTDINAAKRRPALVLSNSTGFSDVIGHSVLAMITSSKNSPWPLDTEIKNLSLAGLPAPSKVRMKLFTLDHRLILSKLGALSVSDAENVRAAIRKLFP